MTEKILFPHQEKAIEMMEKRESIKRIDQPSYSIDLNVGIYADKAGSGKTVSILHLVGRDRMDWDISKDHIQSVITGIYGNGLVVKKFRNKLRRFNTTLILANPILLKQWVEELSFTPLKFFLIHSKKKLIQVNPEDYDLVLCVPCCFNALIDKFSGFAWKRFVFDEPVFTRISSMRPVISGFTWLVTSTPELLLRSYHRSSAHFLSTIFTSCMDYSLYKNMIVKNNDDTIFKYFVSPPLHTYYYYCREQSARLQGFKSLLAPLFQNMFERDQISDLIQGLGGKISSESEVSLREKKCPICLEDQPDFPILLSCCKQIFCGKCVLEWLKKRDSCPLCRKELSPPELLYLGTTTTPSNSTLSKLDCLLSILNKNPTTKMLLFSSFFDTFQPIREMLIQHNISFGELKGNITAKETILSDFKSGSLTVLYIHSFESCAGLNLPFVSDIVFYHPVSDLYYREIQARAYRLGRTQPLSVHCFY